MKIISPQSALATRLARFRDQVNRELINNAPLGCVGKISKYGGTKNLLEIIEKEITEAGVYSFSFKEENDSFSFTIVPLTDDAGNIPDAV